MLVNDQQHKIKKILVKCLETARFDILSTEKDFVKFGLKHKMIVTFNESEKSNI